ncbi:hypothetical protein J6Y50_01845 [bacterium]|nr:hypothetical protein [bacterium]
MPTYIASRWSSNDNIAFPDRLEIDAINVTYYKGAVIGHTSVVIARSNIASVHLRTGFFFADVIIETTGGKEIEAVGFKKSDARAIVALLS